MRVAVCVSREGRGRPPGPDPPPLSRSGSSRRKPLQMGSRRPRPEIRSSVYEEISKSGVFFVRVAVANLKGGTAKTTTAVFLAHAMAAEGRTPLNCIQ